MEALTLLVLTLEFLDEVVSDPVIEVLSTKMSVTGSGLDFKNTLLDRQQQLIESSSSSIEDQHITLALDLLVKKTVSNGGGSGLIDDPENVEPGVLGDGGLTQRVVEVRGYLLDGLADERLSRLAHFVKTIDEISLGD